MNGCIPVTDSLDNGGPACIITNPNFCGLHDIKQMANSEFVDYADNDVVIIDDLRNFEKLQTIKLDFLLRRQK